VVVTSALRPTLVAYLEIDAELAHSRLAGRQRNANDIGASVQRRLDDFANSTQRVLLAYERLGLLRWVDAANPIDIVTRDLLAAMGA